MKWFKRISLFFASALVCAGVYLQSQLDGWFVEKRSAEELAQLIEPKLQVFKPGGTGSFKTVLMFHGCGGDAEQQVFWGETLSGLGYAAVYVDSYAPRRIDFQHALDYVCQGRELRGSERSADVLTAISWAKRQAWVDHDNIVLAGWSHGAWSVMDAFAQHQSGETPHGLTNSPDVNLRDVKQTILFYPYCGIASKTNSKGWAAKPDILALDVAEDTVVGTRVCDESLDWVAQSGSQLQHEIFQGVDHAFDIDAVSTRTDWTYRTAKEPALQATQEAKKLIREFLAM